MLVWCSSPPWSDWSENLLNSSNPPCSTSTKWEFGWCARTTWSPSRMQLAVPRDLPKISNPSSNPFGFHRASSGSYRWLLMEPVLMMMSFGYWWVLGDANLETWRAKQNGFRQPGRWCVDKNQWEFRFFENFEHFKINHCEKFCSVFLRVPATNWDLDSFFVLFFYLKLILEI